MCQKNEEEIMGALEGNISGLKLKDSDVRQRAYRKYCDWLAKGKSQKSFTFEEGDLKCTYRTIESYIKDDLEFPPIHKQLALSKGYAYWEEVVEDSARGNNKDANTASLQMLMRNKFDWDRQPQESSTAPKELDQILIVVKPEKSQ